MTKFLVVVDPGVGSQRRGLYVRAGSYHFVGPDNGVLRSERSLWVQREIKMLDFSNLWMMVRSYSSDDRNLVESVPPFRKRLRCPAEMYPILSLHIGYSEQFFSIRKFILIAGGKHENKAFLS